MVLNNQIITSAFAIFLKYLGILLYLLMLVAPYDFYIVKIIILLLLSSLSLIFISKYKKIKLVKPVITWFIIYIGFGVFFSLIAFLISNNQTIYIVKSMPVNILWPVIYCLILPYINSKSVIVLIHKTMLLAVYIISLYLLLAALSYLGVLPLESSHFNKVQLVVGKYEASVQLFLPSTTSLLFLIPFLISYFLLQIYENDNISSIYVIIGIVFGIVAIVVTARRALILNLLISPILLYFFIFSAKIKLTSASKIKLIKSFSYFITITIIGCIILVKYEILNLDALVGLFKSGFEFNKNSEDIGSSARAEQSVGLIHSFKDYPLLGSGLGSASEYVRRSEVTPWVYELSYLTLLFQTGVIGFIIYLGLLFWIFYKGIILIRSNVNFKFLIPSLVGCFCFLLGNASNPYLIAFDHMWSIFLPIGLINYCYYKHEY